MRGVRLRDAPSKTVFRTAAGDVLGSPRPPSHRILAADMSSVAAVGSHRTVDSDNDIFRPTPCSHPASLFPPGTPCSFSCSFLFAVQHGVGVQLLPGRHALGDRAGERQRGWGLLNACVLQPHRDPRRKRGHVAGTARRGPRHSSIPCTVPAASRAIFWRPSSGGIAECPANRSAHGAHPHASQRPTIAGVHAAPAVGLTPGAGQLVSSQHRDRAGAGR